MVTVRRVLLHPSYCYYTRSFRVEGTIVDRLWAWLLLYTSRVSVTTVKKCTHGRRSQSRQAYMVWRSSLPWQHLTSHFLTLISFPENSRAVISATCCDHDSRHENIRAAVISAYVVIWISGFPSLVAIKPSPRQSIMNSKSPCLGMNLDSELLSPGQGTAL